MTVNASEVKREPHIRSEKLLCLHYWILRISVTALYSVSLVIVILPQLSVIITLSVVHRKNRQKLLTKHYRWKQKIKICTKKKALKTGLWTISDKNIGIE